MFEMIVALTLLGLAIWLMLPEEKAQKGHPRRQEFFREKSCRVKGQSPVRDLPRDRAEDWVDSGRR